MNHNLTGGARHVETSERGGVAVCRTRASEAAAAEAFAGCAGVRRRHRRLFFGATVLWAVVGMLVGVVIALQLAWPAANGGVPYTTFGRLRPLHTNAVIFAFTGNICFTGIYYSLQRLLKVRMWNDTLSRSTSGAGRRSSWRRRSRCRWA
jgi:hypothetical protein